VDSCFGSALDVVEVVGLVVDVVEVVELVGLLVDVVELVGMVVDVVELVEHWAEYEAQGRNHTGFPLSSPVLMCLQQSQGLSLLMINMCIMRQMSPHQRRLNRLLFRALRDHNAFTFSLVILIRRSDCLKVQLNFRNNVLIDRSKNLRVILFGMLIFNLLTRPA